MQLELFGHLHNVILKSHNIKVKKINMVSVAIISQSYNWLIIATETMFIFLSALFIVRFAKKPHFLLSNSQRMPFLVYHDMKVNFTKPIISSINIYTVYIDARKDKEETDSFERV